MKKVIIYALVLTFVTIVTVSGTYAAFNSMTEDKNAFKNINAHEIKVIYSGDTEISGYIDLVKTKEEGFRRTVSIAQGEGSVDVTGNIYVYLEEITAGFSSVAMKWEIYSLNGETETFIDKGTFDGYQSGEKIYMLKNIDLTLDTKEYAIYLWLNGYEAGNEVVDAILRGYIGAETGIVSGVMN